MKISYIEKVTRHKVRISLDNDENFIIEEKQWNAFGLTIGDWIEDDFIDRLYNEYFLPQAKRKALLLLKSRDQSEKELIQKLKQSGYPDLVIRKAVDYVISFHYIDDERYAYNYIHFRGKNKSKKELEYELSRKGIDIHLLKKDENFLESHDDREAIRNIIEKRWGEKKEPDLKEKERMTRYLVRRGFAASNIFSVYHELGI